MPVTNSAILAQIHLSGEVDCADFKPHMLKANFCINCSKLVNKHSPNAIPNDDCLLRAIEFSQKGEKVPSCILPNDTAAGLGGLFHGGFKAVMNREFLERESVTHVVNTAKGLEIFGPKYLEAVEAGKRELNLVFLELGWEDSVSFSIPEADLVRCTEFIHSARRAGGSVLVHCAQGKSRSATAVIAYIMAINKECGYTESAHMVQNQRKMAEPNPTFQEALITYSKSAALQRLRHQLVTLSH